jgi:hypothetical protein
MRIPVWPVSIFCTLLVALTTTRALASEMHWIDQLKDPNQRTQAQWSLRLEKDPKKTPELVNLLGSTDTGLKLTTLQILSETGDVSLWKSIAPLLKDKDPAVQEAAAHALGGLGDINAVPFLIEAINAGRNLREGVTYWALPSDITHNHRYAAVEALNRLTHQDFKYSRALNNFGRMFWLAKINAWWKQQQVFMQEPFLQQLLVWKNIKVSLENISGDIAEQGSVSTGVEEFTSRLGEVKDRVEGIIKVIGMANVNPSELKEHTARISSTLLPIDEIFVYTAELSASQPAWNALKTEIQEALRKLNSFLA